MQRYYYWFFGWLLWLGFALPVRAQIVPNGLGTQVTVNGQQFDIHGGTRAGANLFHSFAKFGLNQGQIANFLSNPAIRNILARVTGGDVSVINGLIKVTGGNSNLYLMNPAGIVFGPNASLNVPAAFHATTANAIKIGNGYFGMHTTAAELATLTAEPNGFAFSSLNQNLNPGTPAGVIVNQANLNVNPGQTIVLAGNQVINTGTIQSPNGTIIITATADGKYVNVSQSGNILSLDLPVAVNQNIAVQHLRPVLPTDIPQLLTGTAYVSGTVSTASAVRNPDSLLSISGERVILDRANLSNVGTDGLIQIRVAPGIANEGYVFLDRVRNYEQLVNALAPGSEAYLLNRTDSGVEKVNQVLAKRGGVQRLDIVGDGNAGQIWFGKDFITLDTLPQYEAQIAQWGQGLTGSREIYLYACNLAASQAGRELVGEISQLTNGNVGASTDMTGHSRYGGNWQLEYSTGNLAGQLVFDAQAVSLADVKLVTFTVTNNADSGAGSLRQAVSDANSSAGADNIAFASGTNGTPIVLTSGELVVSDPDGLTITGNGVSETIIDGNNASRVFNVTKGDITFENLTIRNGKTTGNGGGILASGNVTLNNATVSGNKASINGGGISANKNVTLTNSTVSGNTAGVAGGGILAGSTVTLTNSTVSGNTATIAKHTKVDMIWVAGRSPTLVSQNLKATTLTYLAIVKMVGGFWLVARSPSPTPPCQTIRLVNLAGGFWLMARSPSPTPPCQTIRLVDLAGGFWLMARSPSPTPPCRAIRLVGMAGGFWLVARSPSPTPPCRAIRLV
jgi:filamentous hemagglutinin family protein